MPSTYNSLLFVIGIIMSQSVKIMITELHASKTKSVDIHRELHAKTT